MKNIVLILATVFAALSVSAAVTQTDVVVPGEDGGNFYRIPAIVKTSDGKLLAVYDWRGDYNNDIRQNGAPAGRVRLMKKVSMDNGATWSGQSELLPGFLNAHEHGDAALVADGFRAGHLVCCMAVDAFYGLDGGRIFVSHSYDNGDTWTLPKEMNIDNRPDWKAVFVASGKMLSTRDGAIMCVALGRTASEEMLYVLKSTDGGIHWTVTGTTEAGNESKLVEMPDGSLLMSIRNPRSHQFATSTDGGVTWTRFSSTITESGINSALITCADPSGADRLVLSIATHPTQRAVLALYRGSDPETWEPVMTLHEGLAAYSDIIDLGDGRIGVLAEVIDGNAAGYTLRFYAVDDKDIFPAGELPATPACDVDTCSMEYFDLHGSRVGGAATLSGGIYIERRGQTVSKIAVR